MAVKPIALSFKDNNEDMELYKWIKSHSNLSGFIKDILKSVKDHEEPKSEIKNGKSEKTELIEMDF